MGFSLGIVAAETTRHPRTDARAASLEARRVDQYLPGWLTLAPRRLTAAAVVASVVAAAGSRANTLSDRQILVLAGG